jgi:hypothetical protein
VWGECFQSNSKGPFPLKKNFHGQKIFRKYHCVCQSHFTKFSFCGNFPARKWVLTNSAGFL